ncbi:CACTA en-spm transposon protein [Cucumis melo var. makuwa]|uniref:CACTA en-spm transposon protein n=1 Tax=Cucumis melo var. makuwa TaxID=1194695 RepID=A0A5A7SVK7_CUCMM|nr:CACTA en-spm transposon protein [Cucumis melo var. makuwa]
MNIDSSSVNRHYSNDVLTQALGTKEHNGRVCGVGGYIAPTTYFHSVKKTSKDEVNILVENEELRRRVSELEAQVRSNLSTPLSAHGSCSRPIIVGRLEGEGFNKMPTEKEVACESTSTLPLALKSILRYAEKVMEKDSSITFSLLADLFGISRKTSVLREDIIDLCNMNEVKMFTLVVYMMYLYSSVIGSKENVQFTTRKWIILDAENDVGLRNVGNKGFLDAVNTASGNASGKHYFPTHQESVGKNSSGEGTETERENERRSREGRRENRRSRPVFCRRRSSSSLATVLAAVQPLSATLAIMSYRRSNFMETDDMFLQFEDDLDNNIAGGSSSVGDNTATPTPRRRAQSRLLELERHVAINGRIPMTIAPGAEKPISPHVVRFSQAIGVCVRKTFPVRCLKWADVGREYIERLFVLDFNDQAMNRFVEHQMLTTFKEFRADCHRHFKKYSDPEEARANPPNALVGRDEDWHFLCDHYISRAFQEQSRMNKAARQKQPYNHSSGSKSFLQRQYELAERKGEIKCWNSNPSLPTEGSQPLSEDEICDQVLSRRPGYSKGLGWGPKPKARKTASASSSSTSCSQSTEKEIELQAKLQEALERIEVQDRNHQALASQVESMKKMIE